MQVKKIDENIVHGFDKKKNKTWKNIGKWKQMKTPWICCKAPFDLKLVQRTKSPNSLLVHPTACKVNCKVNCGIKVKRTHLKLCFENPKWNPISDWFANPKPNPICNFLDSQFCHYSELKWPLTLLYTNPQDWKSTST